MKIVYASRTGNVQKLIDRLGVDAVKITNGTEKVDGDYVLITYTDTVQANVMRRTLLTNIQRIV